MAEAEHIPVQSQSPAAPFPWQGLIAFVLLGVVGSLGPDIAPSVYWPDLDHYVPRYVILALSVGFGIAAVHSVNRVNKLLGIAVLVVGGYMVVYIVRACLSVLG